MVHFQPPNRFDFLRASCDRDAMGKKTKTKPKERAPGLGLPLVLLILLIPVLGIYFQAFGHGFVGIDDGGQVPQNADHYGFAISKLITIFSTSTVHMYQPLTTLCLYIIVGIFGFEAAGPFHVFSVSMHFFNAVLVYLLGKKLLDHQQKGIVLALLFALHPLAAESVAWVSATSTMLFAFFFLLSFYAQIQYLEQKKSQWYLLSLLAFILGGFSKVLVLPLVGVLFLLDYLYKKPILQKQSLVQKVPFLVVALFFGIIALYFRGGQSGFPNYDYNPLALVPCQIAWYVFKLFMPAQLVVVYDWPETLGGFGFILSYVFVLGLGFALYRLRANRLFVFGILFYLGNIILHTTLFSQYLGPYADRYAYLSTLGIWLALFGFIPGRVFQALRLPALGAILLCAILAHQQVSVWKDSISLWSQNINHEKGSFAYGMRGAEYHKAQKSGLAKADFEYVDKNPDSRFEPEKYALLYTTLAIMTRETDKRQALEYFKKVIPFDSQPGALGNLARSYLEVGDTQNAEQTLLELLKKAPGHLPSTDSLVSIYFRQNEYAKIIPLLNEMIALKSNSAMLYKKRAFVLLQLNDRARAYDDVKNAVELTKRENRNPNDDAQLMELMKSVGLPQ
jgi:protein O-mannosyl-transferase